MAEANQKTLDCLISVDPPHGPNNSAPTAPNGSYKIFNYFQPSNPLKELSNLEAWKAEIETLTRNKMIVSWSHYTTPLVTLKKYLGEPVSEFLRWMSPRQLGRNHGLFHKFLTFKLKDISDDEKSNSSCFVSFEKQSWGLLFQISKEEKTVRDNDQRSPRFSVQRHDASSDGGFAGLLVDNLASMEKVLNVIETNALYHLLSDNCQSTVEDFQNAVAEQSLKLRFHIPGSENSISLNDEKIVGVVEDMFPDWAQEKVQQFPELPNPFGIEVSASIGGAEEDDLEYKEALKVNYEIFVKKQRFLGALFSVLGNENNTQWANGRKAVISNMTQGRFEDALDLTNQLPKSIVHDLSELWSSALEITAVLESVGVLIFSFQEKEQETDNYDDLLEMAAFAARIGKNQPGETLAVHLINVTLGAESDHRSSPTKTSFGQYVQMSLRDATALEESQLQEQLQSCIAAISEGSIGSSSPSIMNQFVAKLFLLQNLESEEILIHERIAAQNYGKGGFCVWTRRQRIVLEEARRVFAQEYEKVEKICWAVCGGYGAGKTLIMMQMARDFLRCNSSGTVIIALPIHHRLLFEQLKERINKFEESERQRIIITDDEKDFEKKDRLKICSDDKFINLPGLDGSLRVRHGSLPDSESWLNQPILLLQDELVQLQNDSLDSWNEKPMQVHFILFTTATNERTGSPGYPDMTFGENSISRGHTYMKKFFILKEGNLRSSMEISQFIAQFERHGTARQFRYLESPLSFGTSFPTSPGIKLKSHPPKVTVFQTTMSFGQQEKNTEFMHFCNGKIEEILNKGKQMPTLIYAPQDTQRPFYGVGCCVEVPDSLNAFCCESAIEISGCQHPRVIMILKHMNPALPATELEMVMSRATASLYIIYEFRIDAQLDSVADPYDSDEFFLEHADSTEYSRRLQSTLPK